MRELSGCATKEPIKHRLPVNMVNVPTYGARATNSAEGPPRRLFISLLRVLFCLAASVMLAGPATAGAEDIEGLVRSSPHDFGSEHYCAVCHKEKPPALSMDPMATCTKCHHGNVVNHPVSRHPLGIAPRVSVPAYLPLSQDGKMVCFTCHDPHNKSGINKMLRVNFKKLCASCHAGY